MTEPPINALVTPLLTDLYQITMAYGYWKNGRQDEHAVFELFFRKNPFGNAYTIFCGVEEVVKHLANFQFSASDISYLETCEPLQHCEPEFFEYLRNLECSEVTVRSLKPGSVSFPTLPLLIVSGPLGVTQLLETTLLNLVNFPSLIATNASRMITAARVNLVNGRVPKCIEFGLRRAQGPDGGFSASKYAIVGGFDATANVQAGKLLNIPISGTHAHSYIMSFSYLDEVQGMKVKKNTSKENDDEVTEVELLPLVLEHRERMGEDWKYSNNGELAAFISYAIAFPMGFLSLIDTYDTINSGLKNFILVALALNDLGYVPKGIRLDSGDLGALSLECDETFKTLAEELNQDFFNNLIIVASNDINEKSLDELNENGHAISVFGIGTHLVTCQAQPALGCVFKLVELNGKPRIKLSNDLEKVLIPGQKRTFRLYGEEGWPLRDLMIETNETAPKAGGPVLCRNPYKKDDFVTVTPVTVEELQTTIWDKKNGLVKDVPTLMEMKAEVIKQKQQLHPDMHKLTNAKKYDVSVSDKLFNALHEMWNESKQNAPINTMKSTCCQIPF